MKVYQCAAMALLAWPAALPASVWAAANPMHDSIVLADTATAALAWTAPEVPYARLLASAPAQAPHWSLAGGPRHARGTTLPAAQAQPARAITAVPETSTYSMLLVGLGLLALCGAGARQEKFDQGQ